MLFKNKKNYWGLDNILIREKDISKLAYSIVMSDDVFGLYSLNPMKTEELVKLYVSIMFKDYRFANTNVTMKYRIYVTFSGGKNKTHTSTRMTNFYKLSGFLEYVRSRIKTQNFKECYQSGCFSKYERIYLFQKVVELVSSSILPELFDVDVIYGENNVQA